MSPSGPASASRQVVSAVESSVCYDQSGDQRSVTARTRANATVPVVVALCWRGCCHCGVHVLIVAWDTVRDAGHIATLLGRCCTIVRQSSDVCPSYGGTARAWQHGQLLNSTPRNHMLLEDRISGPNCTEIAVSCSGVRGVLRKRMGRQT
eukprot:1836843-Rhodomonas_salina.3